MMVTTLDGQTCRRCAAPLDIEKSRPVAMSCACHPRGTTLEERIVAHGGTCGEKCRDLTVFARQARTARCVTCGADFDDGQHDEHGRRLPGRPAVYCSDDCRRRAEQVRDQAIRDLAKNKIPSGTDALRDALTAAVGLHDYWRGEGPTKPTDPPPSEARTALRERIDRLRDALQQAEAADWAELQNKLDKQRKTTWIAKRDAQAKADRAWRDRLLK